jgi:hypothetical protein
MKYNVKKINGLSWFVEKEDGEEYYVNREVHEPRWVCTCQWNVLSHKTCKHIRMAMENYLTNKEEFED